MNIEETELSPIMAEQMATMARPIPGQALVESPEIGAKEIAKPLFTVPREAIEYVFHSFLDDDIYEQLIQALLDDVSVEELTQAVLFKGFTEGLWNPDLLLLLIEPTAHIIMALSEKAGVAYKLDDEEEFDEEEMQGTLNSLVKSKVQEAVETKETPEEVCVDTIR